MVNVLTVALMDSSTRMEYVHPAYKDVKLATMLVPATSAKLDFSLKTMQTAFLTAVTPGWSPMQPVWHAKEAALNAY